MYSFVLGLEVFEGVAIQNFVTLCLLLVGYFVEKSGKFEG